MRLSSGHGVLWWRPSLSLGGLSRSSPDGAARARSADSCCGAPVFASTKRSRCARPTSIAAAVQSLSVAAKEDDVARSGWTTGAGGNLNRGSLRASLCRSVRCSASSTDAPADARGLPAVHAPSCDAPPPARACADASPLTSCATHTRSRWPAKASRSSSSNASSGTATSGSPRSISRASTTPRSSRPSTRAAPNGAGHHLAAALAGHDALRAAGRAREPACPRPRGGRPPIPRPTLPSGNRRASRTRKRKRDRFDSYRGLHRSTSGSRTTDRSTREWLHPSAAVPSQARRGRRRPAAVRASLSLCPTPRRCGCRR